MNNYNQNYGYNNYNQSYNYNNYNNNYGYNNYYQNNSMYAQPQKLSVFQENALLSKTYLWMCISLAISFICSFIFSKTPLAYGSSTLMVCLVGFIIELFLICMIAKSAIKKPQMTYSHD